MVVPEPEPPTTLSTTSFPVVLYTGKRETNVGNIQIHPNLLFKAFQTKLTELTGISYNNLTTYLLNTKKPTNPHDQRKILITSKANFAVIVKETNCYFFVVLKRSRKERRRKGGKDGFFDVGLSRFGVEGNGFGSFCYDDRFDNMLMNRGNIEEFEFGSNLDVNVNFPTIKDVNPLLCEECMVAERQGKVSEFHHCVYDEVVVGWFRSPAGPIYRPHSNQ